MTEDELDQALGYQHDVGFDEGYEVGYDSGFEDGYQAGIDSVDCSVTNVVIGDGSNKVPRYFTGCSNCGCVLDPFYTMGGFMGPPEYCPRCGAKVIEEK